MPGENYNIVSIPWRDGTGDFFYMDFSNVEETLACTISSDDNNTGVERTAIFNFRGANPDNSVPELQAVAYLKIVQQVNGLIVATFVDTASIYNDNKAGYKI